MLITNGSAIMGTIFDDARKAAMQLKVGDCLSFGSFVPDVDSFCVDVRFPMLWHVIDRKDNKLKLLSYFFFEHYGCWSVQNNVNGVTWENSVIRNHLNNKFFNECFDEGERNAILITDVKTKVNDNYVVTHDRLYVPSLEEIKNIPEHLKIGRGLAVEQFDDEIPTVDLFYCFYWLRDLGEDEDMNLIVEGYSDSELVLDSLRRDADEVGVRAVMWVDAEKIKSTL